VLQLRYEALSTIYSIGCTALPPEREMVEGQGAHSLRGRSKPVEERRIEIHYHRVP
jgi:hypothetical protein